MLFLIPFVVAPYILLASEQPYKFYTNTPRSLDKMTVRSLLSLLPFALLVVASHVHRRQTPSDVPQYVLDYAPIVCLYSSDHYRPADYASQLLHTTPYLNLSPIKDAPALTLYNLNVLNDISGDNGTDIYLTSKQNVASYPSWFDGVSPDSAGKADGAHSCAVIVNDHGNREVDAFYFYFYAYNWGGVYLGFNIGNHVGDWEHNMIRFQDGGPQAIWYSQHSNGEAFTYDAVSKYNNRRVGATLYHLILIDARY